MIRNLTFIFIALSASTSAAAESASAPATDIAIFTPAELAHQDKLPRVRKLYREWGTALLSSSEKVMDAARADAVRDGMTGIVISYSGLRREEHNGLTAMYHVVDAYGVKLVDASPETIVDSIRHMSREGAIEADYALQRATEQKLADAAPALLDYIKNPGARAVDLRAVHAYAAILGQDAVAELTKVLRFHPADDVRVAAGTELVKLGATSIVQDALGAEHSEPVKQALRRALLQ